jgi:hypothetical protein
MLEPSARFRDYWTARAKESLVKARVRCETILFALFLIGGLILIKYPSLPIDRTTWLCGFAVFIGVFLIEFCFISPWNHAKLLVQARQSELRALTLELENVRKQLRELLDQDGKKGDALYFSGVEKIGQGMHPFCAMQAAHVDELNTNDDLLRVSPATNKRWTWRPF